MLGWIYRWISTAGGLCLPSFYTLLFCYLSNLTFLTLIESNIQQQIAKPSTSKHIAKNSNSTQIAKLLKSLQIAKPLNIFQIVKPSNDKKIPNPSNSMHADS